MRIWSGRTAVQDENKSFLIYHSSKTHLKKELRLVTNPSEATEKVVKGCSEVPATMRTVLVKAE